MNRLKAIIVLCTLSISAYSQSKEYKITPEQSKQTVVKYQNAFSVYDASLSSIEVPRYDTIQVERHEYKELLKDIKILEKDSVTSYDEYNSKIAEYNEIISIVTKIDEFQNSDARFKVKKLFLKDAQTIAKKYKFNYFIYADKSINRAKSVDFFSLKLDKVALNNHLNKVKDNVSRRVRKPIQPSSYNYSKLTNARKALQGMERYEYELKQNGTYSNEGIMLFDKIEDLTQISGTFKVIGEYYIMGSTQDGYVQNQLVERSVIENNGLKKYTKYRAESLMKDEGTGKLLFGTSSFLYNCGTEVTLIKFIQKLNKLGYKTEQDGDDIFILTSESKLTLTSDIYKNVEAGNTNYINKISVSVAQYNKLLNRAIPLTDKLVKHFKAYQSATLTTNRFNTWKNELKTAQNILASMDKLAGRDKDNLYNYQKHISTKRLQKHNDFWEVLKGSETILGM
jgi:hypothetical protein